jgi:hypothetical protein
MVVSAKAAQGRTVEEQHEPSKDVDTITGLARKYHLAGTKDHGDGKEECD